MPVRESPQCGTVGNLTFPCRPAGATCQEHFVRKASSMHQESTHLLCQEPTGNKYTAALKWQIPVVSNRWLFACALTGQKVDVKEYPLVIDEKHPEKMNTEKPIIESRAGNANSVTNDRDQGDDHVFVETRGHQDCATSCPDSSVQYGAVDATDKPSNPPISVPTFGRKPFRPSFDTADAMASLASPAPPSLRSRKSRGSHNSFALDDFFVENIQRAVKNTEKLGGVHFPSQPKGSAAQINGPLSVEKVSKICSPFFFLNEVHVAQ